MKRFLVVLAGLGLGATTTVAPAQTIDGRHVDQQQRISNGIANGSLTPGEAARTEHQQASIVGQESRMRARDDGHLTPYDRAVLRTRENRASAHIYRAKHNAAVM